MDKILWPAIIRFNGDDELAFIVDETEWRSDADLYFHSYADGDQFIDSKGRVYGLTHDPERGMVEIKQTGERLTIDEFENWVRNHLVVLNQCCIAKFQISSFDEGMKIIEQANAGNPEVLLTNAG